MSELEGLKARFLAVKENSNELRALTAALQMDAEEVAAELEAIGANDGQAIETAAKVLEDGRPTFETLDTHADSAVELIDQAMNEQRGAVYRGTTGDVPYTVTVPDKSDPDVFTQPGSFEAENQGSDDDEKKSRFSRFGRKGIKNTENLSKYAKDQGSSIQQSKQSFDPWGPDAKTETQQPHNPTGQTAGNPQHADPNAGDIINTGIVLSAMAIELFSRRRKKGDR
ncbi:hypothetical protein [Salininema proteolyticum]|uniref:Uncharacterized protein n=1 Tax=Salininema proteolyticum TaxID=1607685 RepID=A0ABV8U2F4_9ACTN